MKFPIKINQYSATTENRNKYRVDFQIWDKDLLTENDFLSSATIDFWDLVEEATRNESRAKKYQVKGSTKKEIFWIKTLPNQNLKDKKLKKPSRIKVSVELVPKEE
jgi:hypothetical protein